MSFSIMILPPLDFDRSKLLLYRLMFSLNTAKCFYHISLSGAISCNRSIISICLLLHRVSMYFVRHEDSSLGLLWMGLAVGMTHTMTWYRLQSLLELRPHIKFDWFMILEEKWSFGALIPTLCPFLFICTFENEPLDFTLHQLGTFSWLLHLNRRKVNKISHYLWVSIDILQNVLF